MISLLITFFLSFFCCSSVPIYTLDNTKEIEIREETPKKVVYNDQEVILSLCDLFSGDTNYFLIYGLIDSGYSIFQLDNTNPYSLDLPTNGRLFNVYNVDTTTYEQVNTLRINKFYLSSRVVDGVTYYRNQFDIYFLCNNNKVFSFRLFLIGSNNFTRPFVTMRISDTNNTTSIPTEVIGYIESNDYGSNKPYVTYFLPYYRNYNNIPSTAAYSQGYDDGYTDGKGSGYQSGYNQGLIDGASYDDTALTIFTGIIDVGLLPINIFLSILNFDLFGVNVAGFVSALLTVSLVIIIIRIIAGSKNG